MSTEPANAPLIGERLVQLLALIKQADSVELKVTVPDSLRRSAVNALELDPLEGQLRQVWFFDTPDLALERAGVVVRARRTQGRGDDSVVKLRPVVPSELPDELRASPAFKTEVDVLPGGFVCSGSLRAEHKGSRVREALSGQIPLKDMWTKEQRRFYKAHAPAGIALEDLTPLGPVNVFKLKWTPTSYDRKLVAELWFYPDGSRILELSTKCLPDEALTVAMGARAFLESRGLDLSGEQQTKTRTALELFAGELAE
ncbi:MAG: adenylate cyclase [Thermoleophilia bacterium]